VNVGKWQLNDALLTIRSKERLSEIARNPFMVSWDTLVYELSSAIYRVNKGRSSDHGSCIVDAELWATGVYVR
jgi:hypothetical protein